MPSYRPLALFTARLLARRWPLYAFACLVTMAIEAGFVLFVHVKGAAYYPELVCPPLLITLVTVFVGSDATNTLTVRERWERVLERAWALIAIDVGLSFVGSAALASIQAGDVSNMVFGFLTLVLWGMLVYAEPFAALEHDVQTLTIVPFAILRSMMLSWVNISRIFALLAVQIGLSAAIQFVEQKTGTGGRFWIELLVPTALEVPLAALFTVAYLDTVSQERRTTAG